MNRWLQNSGKPIHPPHEDDLLPVLQKAKEVVDRKWAKNAKSTAKLSDFEIIKTLGQGTFGKVLLVRHLKNEKSYYAMKVMPRRGIIRDNHLEQVIMEKRIIQAVKFPFLINYMYHFKNNANIFLVLEYAPGGDMHIHIRKFRKFDDKLAAFYAAQVVLAFEYLHYVGIIYRDLKPENLVIDRQGYLKVTDFGYAKKIDRKKTKTMCGTPEYYAPELVNRISYSYAVDWYTLGILIYEMSEGLPPYKSSNLLRLFQMILDGKMKIPPHFTAHTTSIIKGLTKQSTSLRLRTPKAIKEHQFFAAVDWQHIYNKTAHPPYVPEVRAENDTRNFEELEEEPIDEEPEEIYKEEFKDF